MIHLPAGAYPARLTLTADGSLWAAESGAEAVVRIFPNGSVKQYPVPGQENDLEEIVEGPEGAIWATGLEEVVRIDPESGAVAVDAEFGRDANMSIGLPQALAAGPDGAVWYAGSGSPKLLYRLTPGGRLTTFDLPDPEDEYQGIVLGPDGALWLTQAAAAPGASSDAIVRFGTDGRYTSFPLPGRHGEPTRIVAGINHDLWFTESAGRIGRITTAGKIKTYDLPPGVVPDGIAVAADGTVWFNSSHKLGRISPSGAVAEWRIAGSKELSDVAPGPRGGVWFADSEADTIRYFDPGGERDG